MKTKSRHAELLSALDDMQNSLHYATRCDVLRQAEILIVRQEQEIATLRSEVMSRYGFPYRMEKHITRP
ncbi:MAG TPA: hypothetical protein VNM71_12285 [Steroidobacteraceae bacterium]|nr:hypothetical protein [Steroidobacteraceae bacterium]